MAYTGLNKVAFDPQLLVYPETPEDILASRGARLEAWQKALERLGDRYHTCDSNDFIHLVEITGDTYIRT